MHTKNVIIEIVHVNHEEKKKLLMTKNLIFLFNALHVHKSINIVFKGYTN